jgi:hypothetical protein
MSSPTANAAEIRRLIGSADSDVIARIRATGATICDIIEARAWTECDEVRRGQRTPPGIVGEVYDILAEDLFAEEDAMADDE